MKKLSKILAVLLTLSALCGLLLISVSADSANYAERTNDFSVLSGSSTSSSDAWTTDSTGVRVNAANLINENAQVVAGTNKYLRLYAATAAGTTAGVTAAPSGNGNYQYTMLSGADALQMKNYKYAAFQFLIGAEGGKYVDGAYIKPVSTVGVTSSNFGLIKIVREGDTYYAGFAESATGAVSTKAPLTTIDGDWNVITVVIQPNHNKSSVAVGENANFKTFFYVNGTYVGGRSAGTAVNLGSLSALQVGRTPSTSVSAGDNIILDGYNARFYLNGLDKANNAYTTPDFDGVDDLIKNSTSDATNYKDLFYSKYSTTQDYPTTLVDGKVHTQSAKLFIGDNGYLDVSTAFAELTEGGTVKAYSDVTITGVSLKSFKVEVYDGAKVSFGADIASTSTILPGERDGITRFVVSPRTEVDTALELVNNFDAAPTSSGHFSNGYRTWTNMADGSQTTAVGALTNAGGNKYWKMYPTTKPAAGSVNGYVGFNIQGNSTSTNTTSDRDVYNYKYVATEYLFMAENLNYIEGMAIGIRTDYNQTSAGTSEFSRIYIVKDASGNVYASTATSYGANNPNVALSKVDGAWNIVTMVSSVTGADAAARTATVTTHVYVNGEYLTTTVIENKVVGALTDLVVYGNKNSSATAGQNICIDGISQRYFGSATKDYVTDDYYGLDDFFTDYNNEVEGTAPAYCEDVVYNLTTTVLPETSGNQDYKATINGVYNFLYIESAFAYAESNDKITLNYDFNLKTLAERIKKLTFDGVGVLTVSDAILENYTYYEGVLAKNVRYFVNWLLEEGAEPFKTEELIYKITAPAFPDAQALTDVATDILGDYNLASAWQYKIGEGEYAPLSDFTICDDGDTVTLVPVFGTVIWYHADDTLLATERWFVGSVITKQENDLYGGGLQHNGWYEVIYGWDSQDFIAKPGTTEYRQVYSPVSAVDIKFNFALDGGLAPTYYINAPLDNVKVKSVLASTDFVGGQVLDYVNSYEKVKIDGKDYYMFNLGGVSLADYDAVYSFQVIYEIEIDGINYTLESRVAETSIAYEDENVTAYAKAILTSGAAAECSETTEFIAALIELIGSTYALDNDDTIDAVIDSYVAYHTSLNEGCTCFGGTVGAIPATSDSKVSDTAFTNIGAKLYYTFTEEGPVLTVKVPKTVGERRSLAISASLKGIATDATTKRNQDNRTINVKFRYSGEDEESFIYSANTAAIKTYNAANVQKVVIAKDGATVATATISLGEYVYKMNKALEFYEWINADLDNDGNVDGYKPNAEPIGTLAQRKEFDALLSFINFAKQSKENMTAD